jgi:cytoskeletal protein CcmA (bactofilin family)/DNA-directed RNA polymerase subunit RPC12/RpoP
MAAKKLQEKTLVVCPQCGHQQSEARAAISSNCRQCGSYLRIQELLHPVAKAAVAAPEQRHLTCFDCGAELDVPIAAQSAMCKRCSSYLDLKDYTINNAVSKNFKTKGRFIVENKGYVFNTTIIAGEISIRGQIIGKITAEESLTLYSTAEIKGSFQTKRLIVPADNVVHWREPLRLGGVDVAGELVANIFAEETVTLRAGAKLFGDVQARNLIVEAGAVLVGQIKIGPLPLHEKVKKSG